ncbi:putative uncharacterized protein DDB_G0271606 [Schistocerca cancellata]|uniref:putative uncharacterized protein DDB_G0271606 n=1 Tax=Schistocerca cancellata TaxID=274614 RepID=UPI002118945C|nr:putative uncharacterized protein DDB_G0271606 [Schistocerca cancellata]
MRPTLVAAALPLLLITCVALVGPSAGLPARASSGRPRPRADDLIAGTDFLSVFIGSSLPRTPQQVAKPRLRDSTTAPEDIGFGARLAPKSSSTTLTTSRATPTPFSATTETPLAGPSTRQQDYSSTYGKPPAESDSETFQSSTEPTQRIEDSASELHYRTYPPQNSPTTSDVTLPPDSSISVVTDIVTSKQELISLTAGDPTDGDQHASDGVLSASRITSFYVQRQDENTRGTQHRSPHQTSTNVAYHSSSPHNSVPDPNVHYQSSTGQGAETGSLFHSSVGPSPSYHTVTLHEQRQDHSYQGHSTAFPQSTSNSWFSSHPTQATQIVVSHPGQPTSRPESSTVQQVISVRVSSSVVQGPSSPPNTARSKPFGISQPSDSPFHHSSESSSHDNFVSSRTEGDGARQYSQTSLPDSAQASQERAVEDQQQVVPTSLVTEDQPAATAVQRSQFSVEESSPSDISALHAQRDHHNRQHNYHDDGSDQTIATVVEVPAPAVVNYESRVSSPTSNSRVQFYSGPPPSQPEPVRRHGWTPQRGRKSFGHQGQQQQQQQHHQQQQSQQQQDQQSPAHPHQSHSEPSEHNYEQPEQNYEVDEQLSVVTNGRAHGIQPQDASQTTQPSTAPVSAPENPQVDSAGNKAGYVVEGRGFRKYRVEERTPDGFIVGEYGVVNSEGDPLRAVRYTADGTAPTKLIDQALSHFLSL